MQRIRRTVASHLFKRSSKPNQEVSQ